MDERLWMWLVGAIAALIMALAVTGYIDMDDARTNDPTYQETP